MPIMRVIHAIALCALPQAAEAQTSLAARVASAPDGEVRMQFQGRPGVCGNGRDVIGYRNALFARNFQSFGRWSGVDCVPGPLRVALTVSDRQVTGLRTQVGGTWPAADGRVTDLGITDPREASALVFSLVPRLESASGKDRLLLPAVLADDAPVIEPLLALARDAARTLSIRRHAVQWLGLLGDATVVPFLMDLARADGDPARDSGRSKKGLGDAALAALSTLEGGVGVPALIELARDANAELRHDAVFWLAQTGDPRALRTVRGVIENESEVAKVRKHAIFSLAHSGHAAGSDFAWLRASYGRIGDTDLKEAILHGMTQDGGVGGRWLIERARDPNEPMHLRRTALFWAGQRDETPTADLVGVYRDARQSQLREHAIFVLSQRKDEAATNELLRIAREDQDREMRGKALFWLAQKDDPRVKKLIADLILR